MKCKTKKRITSALTAMLITVLTMPTINTPAVFADTEKTVSGVGTSAIAYPSTKPTDSWTGSYVYYGKYDGSPVKYRVLSPSTTDFGNNTLLLDCDSTLYTDSYNTDTESEKLNAWATSTLKASLNGDAFLNKNGVFTDIEKSSIAKSTKAEPNTNDKRNSFVIDYTPLENDVIFLLDRGEAANTVYGYDLSKDETRIKNGSLSSWWTRSPAANANRGVAAADSHGMFFADWPADYDAGVSPAFNIDLSAVIFSSVITGTAGEAGAEYKLTLADNNIAIAPNGSMTKSGNTYSVPYAVTGSNSANVTQISVFVLDKAYTAGNTNDAAVKYYKKLNTSSLLSGQGTFELPESVTDAWDADHHIYLIAEDVNGENETDYASAPADITSLYYDTLKISETYKKIKDENFGESGWCVDRKNNCVYLIYKFNASEEDLKNYDFVAIRDSANTIMVSDDGISAGVSGHEGKYTEVYKKIEFAADDYIEANSSQFMIGFKLTDFNTQPQNYTISAEVSE